MRRSLWNNPEELMIRRLASMAALLLCLTLTSRSVVAQNPAKLPPNPQAFRPSPELTLGGAWRGAVTFSSGMFAGLKGLEYMYVFHADGTMTESSNYDGVPPVPPAYGIWRRAADGKYEAKY